MNRFEYASMIIQWDGHGKGMFLRQYDNETRYVFNVKKKFLSDDYWQYYHLAIGKLGHHGWEMVSITGLNGSEYSILLKEAETTTHGQELWFKRAVHGNEKLKTIEEIFSNIDDVIRRSNDKKTAEIEAEKERNRQNWQAKTKDDELVEKIRGFFTWK